MTGRDIYVTEMMMGLIYKSLRLEGSLGEREVRALFDTGASECFIRQDIAQEVAVLGKAPARLRFEMATGFVETDQVVFAQVVVNGYPLFFTFVVIEGLSEELILGSNFLQRWKIRLDPEKEEIIIDPSALRMKLV